mmetsp:Transcript_24401/g.21647  ORF Transcript_24401/g.21647 Transcript_24401/m.21647 type:complete len:157 (+) Transcript_24401:491-961(+)
MLIKTNDKLFNLVIQNKFRDVFAGNRMETTEIPEFSTFGDAAMDCLKPQPQKMMNNSVQILTPTKIRSQPKINYAVRRKAKNLVRNLMNSKTRELLLVNNKYKDMIEKDLMKVCLQLLEDYYEELNDSRDSEGISSINLRLGYELTKLIQRYINLD